MYYIRKKIKTASSHLCLVDKFLLIFMFTLFAYTAITLCTGTIVSESTKTVDIMVRTSAASIFGYFVSSNFIKPGSTSGGSSSESKTSYRHVSGNITEANEVNSHIGFDTSTVDSCGLCSPDEDLDIPSTGARQTAYSESYMPPDYNEQQSDAVPHAKCSTPQIIIISIIGLASLVLMFISNRYADATPHSAATLAQLRDFVSACVGFLVSCGKQH